MIVQTHQHHEHSLEKNNNNQMSEMIHSVQTLMHTYFLTRCSKHMLRGLML